MYLTALGVLHLKRGHFDATQNLIIFSPPMAILFSARTRSADASAILLAYKHHQSILPTTYLLTSSR